MLSPEVSSGWIAASESGLLGGIEWNRSAIQQSRPLRFDGALRLTTASGELSQSAQIKRKGARFTILAMGNNSAALLIIDVQVGLVEVMVRRERRWTTAGATPARELVRSTR